MREMRDAGLEMCNGPHTLVYSREIMTKLPRQHPSRRSFHRTFGESPLYVPTVPAAARLSLCTGTDISPTFSARARSVCVKESQDLANIRCRIPRTHPGECPRKDVTSVRRADHRRNIVTSKHGGIGAGCGGMVQHLLEWMK